MKKILLILVVITIGVTVYAQSNSKLLNISKNGSVIYQQRLDGIDSIYFSNMPLVVLSSPANGDTGISLSPTLSWNSFPGSTSYTLQVSTDSLFSSFVYNSSGITGTSQTIIAGLLSYTKYFWRVQANLTYNSQWSQVWNFTTMLIDIPCPGTPTVIYAGETYNTVQIGSQCWLKENLDVGTPINSLTEQTNNSIIEKHCIDNNPGNCTTYGGFYQWAEAVAYTNGATNTTLGNPPLAGNVQGICPTGWHIPTYTEFLTLATTVSNNSNALKEVGQAGGGAGTNTSGFSALLVGNRLDNGSFFGFGNVAYFWSSTEYANDATYFLYLNYNDSNIYDHYNGPKVFGFSVRCIKD